MNAIEVTVISVVLSAVFGTISSLVVFHVKFDKEEKRYREKKVERWEEDVLRELESARQLLIDITSYRSHDLNSVKFADMPPDGVAQAQQSPKFERVDSHIERLEELIGTIPDEHDGMGYFLTEISRQYRGPPDIEMGQSQRDRWQAVRKYVEDAKERLEESRGED